LSNAILDNLADPNANAVNQDTIQSLVQAINSGDSIDGIVQALAQQKVDANEGFIVESQGHTFVDLMRIDDVLNQFEYSYDVASREYKDTNPLTQDRDVQLGDGVSAAVYLPRIDQDLNRFNFDYKTQREQFESRRNDDIREANDSDYNTGNNLPPVSNNLIPVANSSTASGSEDGGNIPLTLTGNDADGTIQFIRVTTLPPSTKGVLLYDDDGNAGTPLVAVPVNSNLTPVQAASIVLAPAPNFNGTVSIPFTVTDNGGATSPVATVGVTVTPVNDPPVATPTPATGNEDSNITVSLTGNDNKDAANGGTVTQVNVTVLPNTLTEGTLYYQVGGAGPLVAVTPATNLTPLEAAGLTFVPVANFNGTVNISYTVTDNNSAISAPANTIITVNPVVDPVVSINDVTVNEGAGTATFTITLNQTTSSSIVVNYNTSNGTALAGSDYTMILPALYTKALKPLM
jgi:Bacterial Ig domain/Calx-beta domain